VPAETCTEIAKKTSGRNTKATAAKAAKKLLVRLLRIGNLASHANRKRQVEA
jgi:hypothetical protein